MIHIEFSGVPGSGKTYLCTSIAEKLRLEGFSVYTGEGNLAASPLPVRLLRKTVPLAVQTLFHPIRTTRIMYTILSTRQSSFRDYLRSFSTITWHIYLTGKIKKTSTILLLDQGSVQALFTLLYAAQSSPRTRIESFLPVPDLLIETDGPDELLAERLASRPVTQSRVEADPVAGIRRSRTVLAEIKQGTFYSRIPVIIPVKPDTIDDTIGMILKTILERISNETR